MDDTPTRELGRRGWPFVDAADAAAAGAPASSGRGAQPSGSAGALAPVPPPTNRGVLRPSGVHAKGLDYLRLTSFTSADSVRYVVETVAVERFGIETFGEWEDQGQAGRILERWTCGVPTLQVEQCGDYVGLLAKGQACTVLGTPCLLAILQAVDALGRWQATRLDFAWDGVPWTVREFYDRLLAGDVRTRAAISPSEMNILTPGNSTAYTHDKPSQKGVERYALCYDMRGPVRLETRLLGRHAKAIGFRLLGVDSTEAVQMGLEATRGLMDLLDPESDARAARRPLWAPWAEFVGQAGRWTADAQEQARERQGLELVGLFDGACQRASRRLCEAAEAFGWDWVMARLKYHGQDRVDPGQVERLKAIRFAAATAHVADVPHWPVESDSEVPF